MAQCTQAYRSVCILFVFVFSAMSNKMERMKEEVSNTEEPITGGRYGSVSTRRWINGAGRGVVQGVVAKSSAPGGAVAKPPPPKLPSESSTDSQEPFLDEKGKGVVPVVGANQGK